MEIVIFEEIYSEILEIVRYFLRGKIPEAYFLEFQQSTGRMVQGPSKIHCDARCLDFEYKFLSVKVLVFQR